MRISSISPPRGVIYDRKGTIVASNAPIFVVSITPADLKPQQEAPTYARLSSLVGVPVAEMRQAVEKRRADGHIFDPVPIKSNVPRESALLVEQDLANLPGVTVTVESARRYTEGRIMAHLLGYLGRINTADQQRLEEEGVDANYRGTDFIGKAGVEASYENELHGTTGFEQVEIDAAGRGIRTLSRTPSLPGNNVTLTIDMRLQRVAEVAFGERRGALVAIEPSSGDILAMVSKPNFDPNQFVDGIDPQYWAELNANIDKPLNNRAISGMYPPGSTFKPFMALAALETGKRRYNSTIHDPGYFEFGGRRFRDSKPGGHGTVDLYKSIVVSSDTYYYMLANDMGIDAIAAFMKHLGLGARTGIDLAGEAAGVLPSPEWKLKRFKRPAGEVRCRSTQFTPRNASAPMCVPRRKRSCLCATVFMSGLFCLASSG